MLEDLGYHPYRSKQPNGYSDLSSDWMSTELIIRRLMYAKKAFHRYKIQKINRSILFMKKLFEHNFDNPDKILKDSYQKLKVMKKSI